MHSVEVLRSFNGLSLIRNEDQSTRALIVP